MCGSGRRFGIDPEALFWRSQRPFLAGSPLGEVLVRDGLAKKRAGEAAIVLCGGRSRRMARDKAGLPFGDETMLERVVRTLSQLVDEVWVVAREDQPVRGTFRIARDSAEGLGPLAGICAGLEAISGERAFVTACDMPLLRAGYVRRLFELSRGHPIAVPVVGSHTMVLFRGLLAFRTADRAEAARARALPSALSGRGRRCSDRQREAAARSRSRSRQPS